MEQLQSRLKGHQKEVTSLERQLHEVKAEADRAKKQRKEAQDKMAELAREWGVEGEREGRREGVEGGREGVEGGSGGREGGEGGREGGEQIRVQRTALKIVSIATQSVNYWLSW